MTAVSFETLSSLLKPEEHLVNEPTILNGESYLINITDQNGDDDKSVFLVLPNRGDEVEAVKVEADVRFRVRAVRGRGRIVLQRAGHSSFSSTPLFSANGHEGIAFTLREGDSYGYHSTSDEPLIIRDDSDVPFLPEYESDAIMSAVGRFNSAAAKRQTKL